jgi:hypothetical protein
VRSLNRSFDVWLRFQDARLSKRDGIEAGFGQLKRTSVVTLEGKPE